jgi:hypothetical protein
VRRAGPARPARRPERATRAVARDRRLHGDERAERRVAQPAAVPTRTSRRAPSPTSSATTAAALGPPSPVLWIVSSAPSGPGPE